MANMGKFAEIVKKTIDEQARFFLERYMDEFTGRWEEVLDQAQEFRKYDINNRDGELQEQVRGALADRKRRGREKVLLIWFTRRSFWFTWRSEERP